MDEESAALTVAVSGKRISDIEPTSSFNLHLKSCDRQNVFLTIRSKMESSSSCTRNNPSMPMLRSLFLQSPHYFPYIMECIHVPA